ncbi:MAG: pilus assembly protein [Lentisphaerae bacterium]|nr:pilus assembly protein [Lentisphaerota bacterium]
MKALACVRGNSRAGQSLVESCLVIGIACLLFFGLIQVSQLFAAREVLYHAAARGARAKTVGFNRWMVHKAIRIGTIPNAGAMVVPDYDRAQPSDLLGLVETLGPGELWDEAMAATPMSGQFPIERARIPEYLATENYPRSLHVLDYEDWDSVFITDNGSQPIDTGDPDTPAQVAPVLHISVGQNYRLWVPLHRTFYARDRVSISGEAYIENHYPLYLEDQQW